MAWDNYQSNTTEPQVWLYIEEKNESTGEWEPSDSYYTSEAGSITLTKLATGNEEDECTFYQLSSNWANHGTYVLTVDGTDTIPIPWYADADQVQAAIDAAVGEGVVECSGGTGTIDILFVDLADHEMSVDIAALEILTIDSDLTIAISANNHHYATVYTDGTVELATVGQYTAPSEGCVRIAPVDATNHPGVALLQFESDAFQGTNFLMSDAANANLISLRDNGETAAYRASPLAVMIEFPVTVADYYSGEEPLQASQPGRTVDVNTDGCVGIDWSNVSQPASTVALSGTTIGSWSETRAGYLDNLNVGGAVASQSSVNSLNFNTRCNLVVPGQIVRPTSGSTAVPIEILLYDSEGNMEAPDSTPTITASNGAGTDRSDHLSAVSTIGTGQYRVTYTVQSTDSVEQLRFFATVTEGAVARTYVNSAWVVDAVAVDFTASDREKLEAVHEKLPTATYLRGTDQEDGAIAEADAATIAAEVDLSNLATATDVSNLQSHGDTNWATATGFAEAGDAMALTEGERTAVASAVDSGLNRTGFSLAATGLDAITATEPTAKPTTFPGWILWLVQRFRRATKTATAINVLTEAGETITTQAITSAGTSETLSAPETPT